jgi:hypothetical protein
MEVREDDGAPRMQRVPGRRPAARSSLGQVESPLARRHACRCVRMCSREGAGSLARPVPRGSLAQDLRVRLWARCSDAPWRRGERALAIDPLLADASCELDARHPSTHGRDRVPERRRSHDGYAHRQPRPCRRAAAARECLEADARRRRVPEPAHPDCGSIGHSTPHDPAPSSDGPSRLAHCQSRLPNSSVTPTANKPSTRNNTMSARPGGSITQRPYRDIDTAGVVRKS